ncbi:MAG: cation:proton antiporter, partial [Halobacteria archaeon]|nr:cation:proton antiporter [Halobacteria archaeon]
HAMSPQTKISIFNTWDTAAFLVNTFIFLLIGAKTPVNQLIEHAGLIALAIPLVLLARAVAVYPIVNIVNQFVDNTVSFGYQHVLLWGGLHASIPIALVLGLPSGTPFHEELRAMVFGVAAFSLIVQGLTMSSLLDTLNIVQRSEAEELYELLVGRARAVDDALDTAERLHSSGRLPESVYQEFKSEYEKEKEELNRAISDLLQKNPGIRDEELRVKERL